MFHWFAHHVAESGSYSRLQQFAVQTSWLSEREIENMSSAVLKPEVAEFRPAGAGPSAEMRRFSAGMRAVRALVGPWPRLDGGPGGVLLVVRCAALARTRGQQRVGPGVALLDRRG